MTKLEGHCAASEMLTVIHRSQNTETGSLLKQLPASCVPAEHTAILNGDVTYGMRGTGNS